VWDPEPAGASPLSSQTVGFAPWEGWPVQLIGPAWRFFCDASTCARRIFVEPFPRVLARSAHQAGRLRQVLLELAHASGAEMAARLAR
jgi:hypothetical protein